MLDLKKTKTFRTISHLKKNSAHHYGNSSLSIVRFLYFSLFSLNIFAIFLKNLDDRLLPCELNLNKYRILTDQKSLQNYRRGKDLPREFYYDEMHGITRFYLVLYKEKIAYIHWVYVKGERNRFLHLNDYEAELNYITTMPEFRGKGLMNQMLRYSFIDLQRQGFKKVYTVVNVNNYPAVKSMVNCGSKEIFRLKAIGQLNRKIRF